MGAVRDARIAAEASRNREDLRKAIRLGLEMRSGHHAMSIEPHTGPYIRPKTGYPSHVTRLADASDYGEVCVLCGFTDLDPHKLEATCYVGGGFCGTHNIVYNPNYNSDLDGVVKAKCTVCDAGTKMGLMGPCYEILPFKPMQVELIAADDVKHILTATQAVEPVEDGLVGEVYTPYGTLTGPLAATQYVADLVATDTAPVYFTD
jgi:hypothetical protein